MKPKLYDVALSFASEDREKARSLADALKNVGLNVFFDEWAGEELWGRNLHEYLTKIYNETTLTILVVSSSYSQKQWTRTELKSLLNSAVHSPYYSILPVKVDDSPLPPELLSITYIDLKNTSYDEFARLVTKKLESIMPKHKVSSEPEVKTYHVIPRFNDWAVKRSGASRATAVYNTKLEAITKAQEFAASATNVEIVVHNSDGTIETRLPEKTRKKNAS